MERGRLRDTLRVVEFRLRLELGVEDFDLLHQLGVVDACLRLELGVVLAGEHKDHDDKPCHNAKQGYRFCRVG